MSSIPYEIVDVFADQPFSGNPLAVVFDAEHLDTEAMQMLAREFNLSETAFVLPPEHPEASYRARIFTPAHEVPFAGHPSIGAAVTAVRRGAAAGDAAAGDTAAADDTAGDDTAGDARTVVQECGAGRLPLTVAADRATLSGGTPTVTDPYEAAPLLAAVGLGEHDAAGPPPRTAGCGLQFPYLSVRPDAVARAAWAPVAAHEAGLDSIIVVSWDAQTRVAHARMFAPDMGIPEDPATGSGALGLGVWLVASGVLPGDRETTYTVRQGQEIGRPSLLRGTVTAGDGQTVATTVTGSVVPVARGEIRVPALG